MIGDFTLPEFKMPYIPSHSESYQKIVIEKLRLMEANVLEGYELHVYCETRSERIRALRLQFTDGTIIIVHGIDQDSNPTYFISTSFSLELTCKMVKVLPETKRTTIGFDLPPKST